MAAVFWLQIASGDGNEVNEVANGLGSDGVFRSGAVVSTHE
jgi:hypothetical protein